MESDARAWVLSPLIQEGRLVGAILLSSPAVPRRIDWEDLDVLRVVCGEAAALIADARTREALAEAQRFDEFNRRFAFILHDLKNLVSQMSLLASNAERHADNPAFRADMVLTLKETVARMTDLLDRLGRPARGAPVRARCIWAHCCACSSRAGPAASGRSRWRAIWRSRCAPTRMRWSARSAISSKTAWKPARPGRRSASSWARVMARPSSR